MQMKLSRQNPNFLDDLIGLKIGSDFEIKQTRQKERPAQVVDELPNLVGPHRNESLVAAVLTVFLLEHNAGDAADFPLLGRDVLAGDGARDGAYDFREFGIGSREAFQVRKRWWFKGVLENRGGSRLGEVAEVKGVRKDLAMAVDQHLAKTLIRGVRESKRGLWRVSEVKRV